MGANVVNALKARTWPGKPYPSTRNIIALALVRGGVRVCVWLWAQALFKNAFRHSGEQHRAEFRSDATRVFSRCSAFVSRALLFTSTLPAVARVIKWVCSAVQFGVSSCSQRLQRLFTSPTPLIRNDATCVSLCLCCAGCVVQIVSWALERKTCITGVDDVCLMMMMMLCA